MSPQDYETSVMAARGELSPEALAAWQDRLKSDPLLAREVAFDAAIDRGMDRIPEIEPRRDSLSLIMEGAGMAPLRALRGEGQPWWRRLRVVEAGLVAAAAVVVAVLFLIPSDPRDKDPLVASETVDTSGWFVVEDEADGFGDWQEDLTDDEVGASAGNGPAGSPNWSSERMMEELLHIEQRRMGLEWRVPQAEIVSGLSSIDDWTEVLEGLK